VFKPTQTIGIKSENATFVLEMRREKSVNNGLSGSWQHKQLGSNNYTETLPISIILAVLLIKFRQT